MSNNIGTILLVVSALLPSTFAMAQNETSSRAPAATSEGATNSSATLRSPDVKGTVWPAPVGHRQPRAADIPKLPPRGTDVEWQLIERDLDGRLKICRAC